jgi:uncharacterized protein YjbI with pentapeptide repeats
MKYRKASPKEAFNAPRIEPDIPAELPQLEDAPGLFRQREITLRECRISNFSAEDLLENTLRLESCVLTRVSFSRSQLNSLKLKDVRLVECDFANTTVLGMVALRVEFQNCRLTGFRANEYDFQHTLISGGDAGYVQFRMGKFRSVRFDSCNFADADFHDADLRGTVIKDCNLRNAEFIGAKLAEADLRGSQLEGLQAVADDLKGAIVDPAQAIVLAEIMGLKIR